MNKLNDSSSYSPNTHKVGSNPARDKTFGHILEKKKIISLQGFCFYFTKLNLLIDLLSFN